MQMFVTNKNTYSFILITISLLALLFFSNANAAELSSTNFKIQDPVIGTGGTYGSSANFKMFSTGNTTLSGANSSSSFKGHQGFMYYPEIKIGGLTATANLSDADLTWVASVGALGWNVASYQTGISSLSGGPYTYTNVGNVTAYSYTNLTAGDYCFVVQTLDLYGEVLGTSNESCVTILPQISFSISSNVVNFGNLSSSTVRYANTTTGSGTDTVAHTMTGSSNAANGYAISYQGSTLSSSGHTIDVANSVVGDGSPGTEQFGISVATSGGASISAPYDQAGPTRTYVENTPTVIVTTPGFTGSETYDVHYLANLSALTEAGLYTTNITYILTATY